MTHTVTWRPGEPCPLCGEVEPHAIVYRFDGTYCEPTESRRKVAELAGHLLFGLSEAERLGFDEGRIRARIAELEAMVQSGEGIRYGAKERNRGQ